MDIREKLLIAGIKCDSAIMHANSALYAMGHEDRKAAVLHMNAAFGATKVVLHIMDKEDRSILKFAQGICLDISGYRRIKVRDDISDFAGQMVTMRSMIAELEKWAEAHEAA